MKKSFIIFMSIIVMCCLMVSCVQKPGTTNSVSTDDTYFKDDQTDSIETENNENTENSNDVSAQKVKMFDSLTIQSPVGGEDRGPREVDDINAPGRESELDSTFATCIITVVDIDISDCEYEKGRGVSYDIHIDKILFRNEYVPFEEGETLTVFGGTSWAKNPDGGFIISFLYGRIPMTEIGAQHIVFIFEPLELERPPYLSYVNYQITNYTIPIRDDGDMTDDEIYALLKLAPDVEYVSRKLVEMYFPNHRG